MAKDYDFEMYGQVSLHGSQDRKFKVYFSEPEQGVNKETGLLLFIAGFGGHANSNVYKKMRRVFADKYNLVTIQCDYFGREFMQAHNNVNVTNLHEFSRVASSDEIFKLNNSKEAFLELIQLANKYKINIIAQENLIETKDNYNDMGPIQAVDNISAVICVMDILRDNNLEFNENKVLLYGHSHGAYLSYLCNAFAPHLFSFLLDNSAWLFPAYLKGNRFVNTSYNNIIMQVEFEYLAQKLPYDEELLSLDLLYKKFENECQIVCFHGSNDNLISHTDKQVLLNIIDKFEFNLIDESRIDNRVFKSNNHGLGADFLEMFDYVHENYEDRMIREKSEVKNVVYDTKQNKVSINYNEYVPFISIEAIIK